MYSQVLKGIACGCSPCATSASSAWKASVTSGLPASSAGSAGSTCSIFLLLRCWFGISRFDVALGSNVMLVIKPSGFTPVAQDSRAFEGMLASCACLLHGLRERGDVPFVTSLSRDSRQGRVASSDREHFGVGLRSSRKFIKHLTRGPCIRSPSQALHIIPSFAKTRPRVASCAQRWCTGVTK